jgi:predicted dienelactone hydrolase
LLPRVLLALSLFAIITPSHAQTFAVGMTTRRFTDTTRHNWQGTGPRPLNTVIWYPVVASTRTAPFAPTSQSADVFGSASTAIYFTAVPVAYDAPLAPSLAKRPLVVISHGNTSLAIAHMWLGAYLASRGYIVAAVNHHGNTAAEGYFLPQGFALAWERPQDISTVITMLLADKTFGPQIDPQRIGAAGHSSGGATVIQLAGAPFSTDALIAFCNSPASNGDGTCEPRDMVNKNIAAMNELKKNDRIVQESMQHEHDPRADPRIRAVFTMAPAVGKAFTPEALRNVHIPVFIVVGDADDVTPPATNAAWYALNIHNARLAVLPHVNHMTFGSDCSPLGVENLDGCRDNGRITRATIHQQVEEVAFNFFEAAWHKKE